VRVVGVAKHFDKQINEKLALVRFFFGRSYIFLHEWVVKMVFKPFPRLIYLLFVKPFKVFF
jgi:hypothetical protein